MRHIDIPGRALLHLRGRCLDAPADFDRYAVFSVVIDRVRGDGVMGEGYWEVTVRAVWGADGVSEHTHRMPLSRLLTDAYSVPGEMSGVE